MKNFQAIASTLSYLCKPCYMLMPVAALLLVPTSAIAQSFPPSLDPPPSAFENGIPVATPAPPPALPSLGQILDSTAGGDPCNSPRFKCVMPDNTNTLMAVLDNETGLVWEKIPDEQSLSWEQAIRHCAELKVGGRSGWHLPMREQLASLIDFANSSGNSALPMDHPFVAPPLQYWTATSDVVNYPTDAWFVDFSNGIVNSRLKDTGVGLPTLPASWCVRGGQSFDGTTSGGGSGDQGGSGGVS